MHADGCASGLAKRFRRRKNNEFIWRGIYMQSQRAAGILLRDFEQKRADLQQMNLRIWI